MFIKESEIIKKIASRESCVIIGRCSDFILKNNKNVLKVFIESQMKDKVKRATKFYGLNKENAENEINKINKLRANHYKYYPDQNWKEPSNYDICINSDSIGIENAANLICDLANKTVNK